MEANAVYTQSYYPIRINRTVSGGRPSAAAKAYRNGEAQINASSDLKNSAASRESGVLRATSAVAPVKTSAVRKSEGIETYARIMKRARENRTRTRFDLLI